MGLKTLNLTHADTCGNARNNLIYNEWLKELTKRCDRMKAIGMEWLVITYIIIEIPSLLSTVFRKVQILSHRNRSSDLTKGNKMVRAARAPSRYGIWMATNVLEREMGLASMTGDSRRSKCRPDLWLLCGQRYFTGSFHRFNEMSGLLRKWKQLWEGKSIARTHIIFRAGATWGVSQPRLGTSYMSALLSYLSKCLIGQPREQD